MVARILVPVKNVDGARKALRVGLGLARPLKVGITCVFVGLPYTFASPTGYRMSATQRIFSVSLRSRHPALRRKAFRASATCGREIAHRLPMRAREFAYGVPRNS